ncbi:MAG TPA: hypothetical protein ACFYEK_11980 [Candidatus Wunengus sp. YC60]|uniref:hypothetical protein n=1 Tax=Candidatus Wunengus sp. YC60 TaxID=3367697 RepID=UPI0040259C70
MKLEQTNGNLRILGDHLFRLIEGLTGRRPQLLPNGGDWYKAESRVKTFLSLRLIGNRARKFPPNSVHLATKWNESLEDTGATKGNNWHSQPSADLSAQADNDKEVARAEDFVRRAFQLYGV